jgi:hypothetical protein
MLKAHTRLWLNTRLPSAPTLSLLKSVVPKVVVVVSSRVAVRTVKDVLSRTVAVVIIVVAISKLTSQLMVNSRQSVATDVVMLVVVVTVRVTPITATTTPTKINLMFKLALPLQSKT